MRKRTLIITSIVCVLLALPVLAATLYEHYTYWLFTGEPITIAWDAGSGADSYTYEVINVERGNQAFILGNTPNLQATVFIPKTGHWVFRIKSINAVGESTWVRSDIKDHSTVNGQPQSWWIFAWIAPVGGGLEIE